MTESDYINLFLGLFAGYALCSFLRQRRDKINRRRWWPPEPETEDNLKVRLARTKAEAESYSYLDRIEHWKGDGNAFMELTTRRARLLGEIAAIQAKLDNL